MNVTILGETTFRNQRQRFGIKRLDRRGHIMIIGKTGVGKSTLLANVILSDIAAGDGAAVIDPHGALIEENILPYIPPHRVADVIYMNSADASHSVSLNLLDQVDPNHRHLVVSGIISIFKKIWFDSWGPRLEHLLRHCLLTLLHIPGATILDAQRLLTDDLYRSQILANVYDDDLRRFWHKEFEGFLPQYRAEATAPILNKIGAFSGNRILRQVIGKPHSTFDMRAVMDERKIVLVNLSKGRLGEDARYPFTGGPCGVSSPGSLWRSEERLPIRCT